MDQTLTEVTEVVREKNDQMTSLNDLRWVT